jgi:hypothetical protein
VSTALRVLAVVFAGRGIMNVLKRFGTGSGFVFFGHLLPADTLLAPALGVALVAYAGGLWTRAAWAVPLGVAYALFATANLLLFPIFTPLPPPLAMWMYALYVVGGIGLCWGTVWLLRRVRAERA